MLASPGSEAKAPARLALVVVLVLAGLLLVQASGFAAASGPDGTLKGYVTDAVSGLPVIGALVRIEAQYFTWTYELSTDPSGYYETPAVPALYNVIVVSADHEAYFTMMPVGVGSAQTTWHNASLVPAAPRDGLLHGYVNDTVGTPITFGRVVATPGGGPPSGYINVSSPDGLGYYEMAMVPGTYQVFTDGMFGYYQGSVYPVDVSAGTDTWLNFTLFANPVDAFFNGTVYDLYSGVPLAGATVTAEAEGGLLLPPVLTNGLGEYSLPAPSGGAQLTADLPGYAPETTYTFVSASSTTFQDFYLRALNSTILGFVTDGSTGLGIPGALVAAEETFTGLRYDQGTADGSGFYSILIADGVYEISASADGYAPENLGWWGFPPDSVTWVNFTLWPMNSAVQGYLIDASNGSYVPGLAVVLIDVFTGDMLNFTYSNASGYYYMGAPAMPFVAVVADPLAMTNGSVRGTSRTAWESASILTHPASGFGSTCRTM